MSRFIQILTKKILIFLQVQCFLTLASLPILVSWGLPISCMTAVGNCIFGPFIFAFLFFSSMLFFTEFLHIPNGVFIVALEWISTAWLKILSYGSKKWMLALPLKLVPLLVIIALGAFAAFFHKTLRKPQVYFLFFLGSCTIIGLANILIKKPKHITLTCKNKAVCLARNGSSLELIDHGGLGEKRNPSSWISYTLIPELAKQYGATSLDKVICHDNKKSTQKAIEVLCRESQASHIIWP